MTPAATPNPLRIPMLPGMIRAILIALPWLAGVAAFPANALWFFQRHWWLRLAAWTAAAAWSAAWGYRRRMPGAGEFRAPTVVLGACLALVGAQGVAWGLSPTGVVASIAVSAGAAALFAVSVRGSRPARMKAVAIVLALGFAIGATEGFVRVIGIGGTARERGSRELARRFNNLTPPRSAFINQPKTLDEFPPSLVAINSVGIRGPEVTRGRVDLLLLGDSYVEARQLPWEQTVTRRLQEALEQRAPGVTAIGHGMRGWSTLLYWNWYLKVGREFHPRVLLLFFFWNDLPSVGTEAELYRAVLGPDGRPAYFNAQVDPWWIWYKPLRLVPICDEIIRLMEASSLKRLLARPSLGAHTQSALDLASAQRLARQMSEGPPFARDQLQSLLTKPIDQLDPSLREAVRYQFWPGIRPMDLWWPGQREAARATEAELEAFSRDVAADGGRLVMVYVPNPYQLPPSECSVGRLLERLESDVVLPPDSGTQAWLRMVSARYGIEFLDPSGAMREAATARAAGGQPPLYLRADCHWSAPGHQFMANWLADWYLRSPPARSR